MTRGVASLRRLLVAVEREAVWPVTPAGSFFLNGAVDVVPVGEVVAQQTSERERGVVDRVPQVGQGPLDDEFHGVAGVDRKPAAQVGRELDRVLVGDVGP